VHGVRRCVTEQKRSQSPDYTAR